MRNPIFVMGAAGSGTTLLRLILDSHPNIAIGPETAIMRLVKVHRWIPYWPFGRNWWTRFELTEEELNRALRDFYGGLFERAAQRQGKSRWGEKTPFHVWYMDDIAKVWDDAVFVTIVRHPAASIASNVNRFRFSVAMATRKWIRMNRVMTFNAERLPGRLVLLRYEDLVADPESVLRELLEWLGEPWSPAVLEHHRVQKEKGASHVTDGRTRPGDAIDKARASKWMTVLTDQERAYVRQRAGAWAEFFGYEVDEPEPARHVTTEGSTRRYLLTAEEIAVRRQEFADRIDLRPPEVKSQNRMLRPPRMKAPAARRWEAEQAAAVEETSPGRLRRRVPAPARRALDRLRRRLAHSA
jgi:hypothetical protein